MTAYTFDIEIFSDLYKDAYGHRPRNHPFYWADDAEKQQIWDRVVEDVNDAIRREREEAEAAVVEFETLVAKTIDLGAGDRETALRWLTSTEDFYHQQDIEHWVWKHGILFTDAGRLLLEALKNIVEIKEYA